jgi:hypothetical protein
MHRSIEITADDSRRGSLGQNHGTHAREVVFQLLYEFCSKVVNMEVLLPRSAKISRQGLSFPADGQLKSVLLLDKNCGRILRPFPGSSHRHQTSYSTSLCEAERPVNVASSTLSGVVMTVILYRVAIQRTPPETVQIRRRDPIATLPFAAF